jgi:inorganic pyrophosphatase
LILSTIFLIPTLYLAAYLALPDVITGLSAFDRSPVDAWLCTVTGLVSGVLIGFVTEYYTSHSYTPVRKVVATCETGAATNVI